MTTGSYSRGVRAMTGIAIVDGLSLAVGSKLFNHFRGIIDRAWQQVAMLVVSGISCSAIGVIYGLDAQAAVGISERRMLEVKSSVNHANGHTLTGKGSWQTGLVACRGL